MGTALQNPAGSLTCGAAEAQARGEAGPWVERNENRISVRAVGKGGLPWFLV